MNIKVQGMNNFDVSERMNSYIEKRAEKLTYFKGHIDKMVLHLEKNKHLNKVSVTLSIHKLGQYQFEATADNMYSAIDKVIHKADVKINKEKSKIQKHNKLGHEEIVSFFYEHEKNKPEPTKNINIIPKPTTLQDAILQMKTTGKEYYGFNFIDENETISPAFLRKLEDDFVCFVKNVNMNLYAEYSINIKSDNPKEEAKVRDLEIKKMNLLDAQKNIMEQDFHYDVFLDNEDRINFLYKEGNGKWTLIS